MFFNKNKLYKEYKDLRDKFSLMISNYNGLMSCYENARNEYRQYSNNKKRIMLTKKVFIDDNKKLQNKIDYLKNESIILPQDENFVKFTNVNNSNKELTAHLSKHSKLKKLEIKRIRDKIQKNNNILDSLDLDGRFMLFTEDIEKLQLFEARINVNNVHIKAIDRKIKETNEWIRTYKKDIMKYSEEIKNLVDNEIKPTYSSLLEMQKSLKEAGKKLNNEIEEGLKF